MDLKLNFAGLISVLGSEWISLLQFTIDLLLENHWDLLKGKRTYVKLRVKYLSHKYVDIPGKRIYR